VHVHITLHKASGVDKEVQTLPEEGVRLSAQDLHLFKYLIHDKSQRMANEAAEAKAEEAKAEDEAKTAAEAKAEEAKAAAEAKAEDEAVEALALSRAVPSLVYNVLIHGCPTFCKDYVYVLYRYYT
jgi:FKBP-type peptidyl-prolyl cis-trans isomerase